MAFVPGMIARNWRLKLAAFGLTVLLWALVRTESGSQGNLFSVPVQPQVADLDWTLAGEPDPPTVQVRFRGPTDDLIRLAREGTTLRVPLDSVASPDTVVQLRRDWVFLSGESRLVVEDIAPASVRLALERAVTRAVPSRVITSGELSGGRALAAPISTTPGMITVRGPAQRVRGIPSIPLRSLDLGSVGASGDYEVEVDTTGLSGLSLSPARVALSVRVEPRLQRELPAVPVALDEEDAPMRDSVVLLPPTILVRIDGARTAVTGAHEDQVRAVIPRDFLVGLQPGHERRAPIRLRGLPALVRGFAELDSVTVRRVR